MRQRERETEAEKDNDVNDWHKMQIYTQIYSSYSQVVDSSNAFQTEGCDCLTADNDNTKYYCGLWSP